MAVINILSPHVADLIAAGEVVERPASVIKELVENSFDAGAKNITVEIRGGGATYIRVTDDGCGMAPEDAGIAFLRHATSKLHDERGLESIGTMGFRGEALAAISSVSNIELTTRLCGASDGTRMKLSAGDISDMTSAGCPTGTTIVIRDLFFNTPARLKFLKSDRSEASACQLAALRCALGRPDVSVRYIRDGQEELFSPGDGRIDSVIYTLLGRETAVGMLPCTGDNTGMTVEGFISSPSAGRGNRAQQYFYCNGRFIKSTLLQAALEQAYKNSLLTGRYPSCVLYINIGTGSVDVNVHPAKTEVKFTDEKKVFDLVYYAALSALTSENRNSSAQMIRSSGKSAVLGNDFEIKSNSSDSSASNSSSPSSVSTPVSRPDPISPAGSVATVHNGTHPTDDRSYGRNGLSGNGSLFKNGPAQTGKASPRSDFYRSMSASEFRNIGVTAPSQHISPTTPATPIKLENRPVSLETKSAISNISASVSPLSPSLETTAADSASHLSEVFPSADTHIDIQSAGVNDQIKLDLSDGIQQRIPQSDSTGSDENVGNSVQNVEYSSIPDHKIVGEALKTYIIVEVGEELILIDKHAAHERMNFDRLKAQDRHISSQMLLTPVTLHLSGDDAALLEENADLLSELGFEIDPFGEFDFIIRSVPAEMDAGDAVAAIEEICEKLRLGKSLNPGEARDELLHTVACKAAIKAGWTTSLAELERIACEVLSGRVKYCPHGRPVSMVVTRTDLDKLFKRIL